MHRAVPCATSIALAIETAVVHSLREDEVDDALQLRRRRAEVACVVQEHAIDADIARGNGVSRTDSAIELLFGTKDGPDALSNRAIVAGYIQEPEVEKGVVGTRPLGLIEPPTPRTVVVTAGKQPRAPAFSGDARLKSCLVPSAKVSASLIADGHVPRFEPGKQRGIDPIRRAWSSVQLMLRTPSGARSQLLMLPCRTGSHRERVQ
jgi:hypothetical protein